MPELAEVEYNRKQWDVGLTAEILSVSAHGQVRDFRETAVSELNQGLRGARYLRSEARGKQMMFEFSGGSWVGIHLGMTGRLRVEGADYGPGKHDHLVLYQAERALVFTDPRQFGRVRFHQGNEAPGWWSKIAPSLMAKGFTVSVMEQFLRRHRQLPMKAALLLQNGFPGIGNWMADEILWRAGVNPKTLAGKIIGARAKEVWREIRFVCRKALKHIGPTYAELPEGWLFHERWSKEGKCPRHGIRLRRESVGGRTTAWCGKCQRG